jgi:hypothetical protein
MKGSAVVDGPGSLTVGQEWFSGMAERDLLDVAERLDRRVLAGALTDPSAQQRSQDGDAGMEVDHVPQVTEVSAARRAL